MKGKIKGLTVVATVLLVIGLLASAHASSESLYVSPGQDITRDLDLTMGDTVTGTLTIIGNSIDFMVTNSSGNTILQDDSTLGTTFSFTATSNGTYTMHFARNSNVLGSAQCTIDYSITAATTTEPSGFSGNTPTLS